jgi:broad specificity phosphatase PhoE
MTRFRLVRHAEPAASWDEHLDPGLSPTGARQADELAARVESQAPGVVVSSPLARARATAAPVAAAWGVPVRVEPSMGEVPTPDGERSTWLRAVLATRWPNVDDATRDWRRRVLDALARLEPDAVVATHFVAINVAVGAATGDDRVWCCSPAHASVTELTLDDGTLTLVALGAETASQVT